MSLEELNGVDASKLPHSRRALLYVGTAAFLDLRIRAAEARFASPEFADLLDRFAEEIAKEALLRLGGSDGPQSEPTSDSTVR